MAITLNGTTGISSPGGDTSTSLATTNLSYTGTLTGGTGVIAIGTTQIYKDASGNVGIGTGTPSNRLQVQDSTANNGTIQLGGSTYYGTIKHNATVTGANEYNVASASGGGHLFQVGGSTLMNLTASGNLGLGVTPNSGWVTYKAFQFTGGALTGISTTIADYIQNGYYGSSGYAYATANPASIYRQSSGAHQWYRSTDGSPTANSVISFTQAMTLDASGNLNIGNTSNSGAPLQVQVARTVTTNAVSIILSDLASGVQTNGVYKSIRSLSNGGSSVSEIRFLETDGTNNNTGIAFATQAVAGGLTERARLDSSGNFLIGDTAFSYGYNGKIFARNDVNTTPVVVAINKIASGNAYGMLNSFLSNGNNTTSYHFSGVTQGVNQWYLYGNGTSSFTSDERKKKNIETARSGYLEDLCKLRVVKYNWWNDDDSTPRELGLIAQEVEKVFPGLITDAIHPDVDGETYKVMKGSVIPFMLLKAIQELTTRLEALEAKA